MRRNLAILVVYATARQGRSMDRSCQKVAKQLIVFARVQWQRAVSEVKVAAMIIT